MRPLRSLLPTALALGVLAGAGVTRASAQAARAATVAGMPESYRQVQLSALELQRRLLLAMADSMPETEYRDKMTPIQRHRGGSNLLLPGEGRSKGDLHRAEA